MTQPIDQILNEIGNPNGSPHQPEGDSDVTPLSPLGLKKPYAEPSPPHMPTSAMGAGSSFTLTPGAQGSASDGTVEAGNDDHYADQGGPNLLGPSLGIGALTAGGNFGANRPADGAAPAASEVGRPDHALGRDQSEGQGLNPALGRMPKTPPGNAK